MSSPVYRQLEIRWIDLEPTKGSETQKKRPCVIIQADIINRGSKTIIIAPLLPGHKNWPFAVNVQPSKNNGLDKERHINLKQMRVVDVSRILNRQGILEQQYLTAIQEAIKIVFAL
jgi:mRNA interferase MazF